MKKIDYILCLWILAFAFIGVKIALGQITPLVQAKIDLDTQQINALQAEQQQDHQDWLTCNQAIQARETEINSLNQDLPEAQSADAAALQAQIASPAPAMDTQGTVKI